MSRRQPTAEKLTDESRIPVWTDYNMAYREALRDVSFVKWREAGARQKALNIARVCRQIPVSSVIEIGCGTGAVLRELGSLHFAKSYVATDISAAAVEFAQKSCGPLLSGAFVGSADLLPFAEKTFSVSILSHVIEHLEDPGLAVRKASRMADYLVVEVPIERVLSNSIRTQILGRPFASAAAAGHVQFWNYSSIANFLEKDCGQKILGRHRDLLSREIEFHGRKSIRKVRPLVKEILKTVLPGWIYSQLLTTHATFLCQERLDVRES